MIFISHRGNLNGRNANKENKIKYITTALEKNFDVEVDIWYLNGSFYLGHDEPEEMVDFEFLKMKGLWFHAKNIDAFHELLKLKLVCFWHQEDDVTLTSNGYIWTYPGKPLTSNSICVLPEIEKQSNINCAGICSDYILDYFNKKK